MQLTLQFGTMFMSACSRGAKKNHVRGISTLILYSVRATAAWYPPRTAFVDFCTFSRIFRSVN